MIWMEIEPMHFLLNIMTIFRTVWQNILFGDPIKPMKTLILIYPNEAGKFLLYFL